MSFVAPGANSVHSIDESPSLPFDEVVPSFRRPTFPLLEYIERQSKRESIVISSSL